MEMDENHQEGINFIKNELLPEAVHNRCFCEPGSREFVEFVSTEVESFESLGKNRGKTEYYRARLIVNFSGEPKIFQLVIKLSCLADDGKEEFQRTYDEFLNEEMFYSKIAARYKLNVYPRCYVADMGRYGRPVIVLEDLETCGYARYTRDGKLDEYHLALCLKAIVGLHERGLRLQAENYNSFREFYAKLIDTRSEERSKKAFAEESSRISRIFKKLRHFGKDDLSKEEVTICHGNLTRDHFFFKYENGRPIDVKIIGWKRMRYCSIIQDLIFILQDNSLNDEEIAKYLNVYVNAANK